jgi:hypothetical protein
LIGSRLCGSTPGACPCTARPKYGSVRTSARCREPSTRDAASPDRHASSRAELTPRPAGVDEPAIDLVTGDEFAQEFAIDRRVQQRERRAETGRKRRLRLGHAPRCSRRAPQACPWDCDPYVRRSRRQGGHAPRSAPRGRRAGQDHLRRSNIEAPRNSLQRPAPKFTASRPAKRRFLDSSWKFHWLFESLCPQ